MFNHSKLIREDKEKILVRIKMLTLHILKNKQNMFQKKKLRKKKLKKKSEINELILLIVF